MRSNCKHWDAIFSGTEDPELGWYEKNPAQTLKLLKLVPDLKKASVFIPGAGTSVLIEKLFPKCAKIIVNDISPEALSRVKKRVNDKKGKIEYLCQDISRPLPRALGKVDIWIDRAVLHFLRDKKDISGYFKNVRSFLKPGGHAIFSEFSKTGAPKCAGLPLHRYSVAELSGKLGKSFKLVSHFDYTFINPNGDPRPYIYTLFKKKREKGTRRVFKVNSKRSARPVGAVK